jgi:predicted nucleic-acid-binding Zn-ribbon protein
MTVKDKKCLKCGSSNVIPSVPIADRSHMGELLPWVAYISEKPNTLFSKIHFFKIRAWICGECGYTELYADEPNEVAKSYQRYLENINSRKK